MHKFIIAFLSIVMLQACASQKKSDDASRFEYHKIKNEHYCFAKTNDINACLLANNSKEQVAEYVNGQNTAEVNPDASMPRKVLIRNVYGVLNAGLENQKGTDIKVQLSIDRLGEVVVAKFLESSTVKISEAKIPKILEGFMSYKYESDPSTACVETGMITIKLENLNALKKGK